MKIIRWIAVTKLDLSCVINLRTKAYTTEQDYSLSQRFMVMLYQLKIQTESLVKL